MNRIGTSIACLAMGSIIAGGCDSGTLSSEGPDSSDPAFDGGASGGSSTGGYVGTSSSSGALGGSGGSGGGSSGFVGGGSSGGGSSGALGPGNGSSSGAGASSGGGSGSSSNGGKSSGGGSGSGGSSGGGSSGSGSGSSGSSGGGSSGGGSSSGVSIPACTPPTSGTAGYATRYWDCCKPSCGSSHTCAADGVTRNDGAKDSCQGGPAYECYDMTPQVVSDSMAYAFAAFDGASCGTCFQLTFTGKSNDGTQDTGSQLICGKSIIVQVVNTGGLQSGQFDLLIPGGGVGANNACSTQWKASGSQLGVQYGGVMLQCEQQDNYNYSMYPACTTSACQSLFPNTPTMATGCQFIVDWMKGANNPSMRYTQVTCPSQLTNVSGL